MGDDRLLGFDARAPWSGLDEQWNAARRDTFLLRLDVLEPLSVDPLVWPSVFDTGQGIGLPGRERQRLQLAGLPVPSWIGPNAGLWDDLARMRRYLALGSAKNEPHVLIAIGWFPDRVFPEGGPVGPYRAATVPAEWDPAWSLLGFDVADGSLVSGLSNCGYSPVDAEQLRRRWSPHLNTRHLFSDQQRAAAFREVANERVPEHAPFFVYGLFLVTIHNPKLDPTGSAASGPADAPVKNLGA